MLKILKHLGVKEWLMILASTAFIVMQVWLDLKLPDYMKEITAILTNESGTIGEIWKNGGLMLACALGSAAGAVVVGFFAGRIAATLSLRVRSALFSQVESFSMAEINRFSTPSLITRSTNDITQIQMLVAMGLQMIIKAPILAVWAITKISTKSWQWTAMTGVALAIMLILIVVIVVFAIPKFKKIQTMTDNINRVTRENLTGIRVVRAYNAEHFEEAKFEGANEELTKTNLFVNRVMALISPVMGFIMSGLTLSIYWVGVYLIDKTSDIMLKADLFTDMIVFSSYAMQVIMAFMMLAMIFIMLPRAQVSAKRINEVLDVEPSIRDGAGAEDTGLRGEVEFKNVSFKYPDAEEYVLKDISFTAKKGEVVAFIGSTGSGKSTLINLVPRFYDASEGEVLVDGVNVKDYRLEDLNNKLGYVPQRGVLFSGTVRSNVSYGKSAQEVLDADVVKAIEIAQGTGFVEKMTGAYDAPIAQGGTNVSGGQKQRLSIARAVARKPEIYIFDDSFSALDYKTDKELRGALKRETADATSLIVAQRIGTIKHADQILVLDNGILVGHGTHDELMKNCPVYQEIAYSQLSKEELA